MRKLAGIEFPGWDSSVSSILAEVEMKGQPEFGFRNDALGVNAMRPVEDGRVGVVVRDPYLDRKRRADAGGAAAGDRRGLGLATSGSHPPT